MISLLWFSQRGSWFLTMIIVFCILKILMLPATNNCWPSLVKLIVVKYSCCYFSVFAIFLIQIQYGEEVESTNTANTQNAPVRENGTVVNDASFFSNHNYKKKKSPLRVGKKVYEFYNAPITKFWANTVSSQNLFFSVLNAIYLVCIFLSHRLGWCPLTITIHSSCMLSKKV